MAIAVGAQEGFSWNAVAIGAISGGVSGGLAGSEGATAFFDKAFGPLAGTARGMAGSVISQGIAVATGVQSKFDWTSVAVAGVTAGVADLVGWGLGPYATSEKGKMAVDAVADLVGGVAGAATRTALTGADFGDNLRAVLPDVIATTIGSAILAGAASKASGKGASWTADGQDPIGDLVDGAMASAYPVAQLPLDVEPRPELGDLKLNAPLSFVGNVDGAAVRSGRRAVGLEFGDSELVIPGADYVKTDVNFTYDFTVADQGLATFTLPAGKGIRWELPTINDRRLILYDMATSNVDYDLLWVEGASYPVYDGGSVTVSHRDRSWLELRGADVVLGFAERVDQTAAAFKAVGDHWRRDPGDAALATVETTLIVANDISRSLNPMDIGYQIQRGQATFQSGLNLYNDAQAARKGGYLDRMVARRIGYYAPEILSTAATAGEGAVLFNTARASLGRTILGGLGGRSLFGRTVAGDVIVGSGPNAARMLPIARSGEFIGPVIGRSGFKNFDELSKAVGVRYQTYVDDAYDAAMQAEARGSLRGNPNTRVGDFVDRESARRLKGWLEYEGLPESGTGLVQMNRWLRDPTPGSSLYVRPDVRIPRAGVIYDATVGFKPHNSTQLTRFGQFSGGDRITVVRPGAVGGSYSRVP